MIKDFTYYVPVKLVFGMGAVENTGEWVKQYGKRAFIVTTGRYFEESGLLNRVKAILKKSGVSVVSFSHVTPNPLSTQIDEGAKSAQSENCDVIIGLGGGSAIDAAKGIAIALGHKKPIWDFCVSENPAEITDKTLPIIAITTTSGTGSEGTQWAVITNPKTREKPGIGNDYTFAKVAIVDPELMVTMPAKVTASTGFDVLTHAIEAYTSTIATPITDMYCETAIRLVGKYLRRAVHDGKDMEARNAMAYANTLAGFAIAVGVVTTCHALAHAVGGVANTTTHGETLAAMTQHAMRFSMGADPEKYSNIGILLMSQNIRDGFSAEDSVAEVEKLKKDIGLEESLSEQGVREADLEEIVEGTLRYMKGNLDIDPVRPGKEDLLAILKKSF
ncbi:MAG: iron-containing alcohol dehydrogenase [Deltaproteobacteria bacterium]|nr:iron-containing alcohol dehydrogenase [Deltaproteobacteria bacterium]